MYFGVECVIEHILVNSAVVRSCGSQTSVGVSLACSDPLRPLRGRAAKRHAPAHSGRRGPERARLSWSLRKHSTSEWDLP